VYACKNIKCKVPKSYNVPSGVYYEEESSDAIAEVLSPYVAELLAK